MATDNTSGLDRLKSQLLTSGLQEKNQALFQVINQMVDFVRSIQTGVSTIKETVTTIAGNYAKLDASNIFTKINPLITAIESWIGPSDITGIYFKGGNVGIGNNNPGSKLEVTGNANVFGGFGVVHDVAGVDGEAISVNPAGVSPPLSTGTTGLSIVTGDDVFAGNTYGLKSFVGTNLLAGAHTCTGLYSEAASGHFGDSRGVVANMSGTETRRLAFVAQLGGFGTEYSFHCDTPGAILYNEGNVGIGVATPQSALEVAKNGAGVQDTLYLSNTQAAAAGVGSQINFSGIGNLRLGTMYAQWAAAATTDAQFIFEVRRANVITETLRLDQNLNAIFAGKASIGIAVAPTASLEIKAGTAVANTAPIKFRAGVLLAALELGAVEFVDNGTTGHLYITLNVAGVLTRVQIV